MTVQRLGNDFQVNIGSGSTPRFIPDIAGINGGGFMVVWQVGFSSGGSSNVWGRVFNANGQPIGNDFRLYAAATGSHGEPSVAAVGSQYVTMLTSNMPSDGDGYGIRMRKFSPQGNGGAEQTVNTTILGSQFQPDIADLGGGRFVAVWESGPSGGDRDIRARFFDANGPIGNDFAINFTTAGNQLDPAVVGLGGNRFMAFWRSGAGAGDGAGDGIQARVFSGIDTSTSTDLQVNTTTPGNQTHVEAVRLGNGRVVAVWVSGDPGDGSSTCIRARVFDNNGNPLGNDFLVNTTGQGAQGQPHIAALADGRAVAVWQSADNGDGSGGVVRARLLDHEGRPIGADFIVNTTTSGNQTEPAVAAFGNGRFVVSFISGSIGTGDNAVRAATFDPTKYTGSAGADLWHGGSLADTINGLGGNDTLRGFGGNDTINGGAGNDTMNGGVGSDTLNGGAGNDIFQIAGSEGVGDTLLGGAGTDKIQVLGTAAPTLAGFRAASSSIEQWQGNGKGLSGTSAANVFDFTPLTSKTGLPFIDGKGGNDKITGSKFADDLRGGAGNDTLNGGAGNDKLSGGAGNDVLTGGAGKDILTGGAGKDKFDFNAISETKKGGNRDQIKDFKRGQDKIDVRDIDANTKAGGNQNFKFIGDNKFSKKPGELRFDKKIVQGDVNGDGKVDFEIHVNVNKLTASDFVL